MTSLEQIQKLIGDLKYLGLGSWIIITTRDKQVLKNSGVDDENICEVKRWSDDASLQLFRNYAFTQNYPTNDLLELSNEIVIYTKGVPLALKILGSCLFGKKKEDWESEIDKLEKSPHKNIIITMCDLFQEMGKEIVQQESINVLGKHSQLWHHKDIHHVLAKNAVGTDKFPFV